MWVGVAIYWSVGTLLVILGLLLWKKQKVSLLHDYHYQHVAAEDLPAYTRAMGIGLILMGAGIGLTGVLCLVTPQLLWALAPMAAGLISGLIVMHKAQMKYNGSWLG